MTAKRDWTPYEKELLDLSLSTRKAAEAIEQRTGDKIHYTKIVEERKRRGLRSGADVATVKQTETPESSPMETRDDNKPDDFSLIYETPQPKRRGRPSKLSLAEAEARQVARYNAAGAVEAADADEVRELKELMGKIYTIEAVAAALGCTVRAVQNYLKSGRLRGVKVAGAWVISAENFKRFFDGAD